MTQQYDQIIQEHFDITDSTTRKTLVYVNEADKSQVLAALANKLYGKIVKDVANIDYGNIPDTKGDITKMQNFIDIKDTLTIIKELLEYYKQPTTSVDTVLTTIDNVVKMNRIWEKAFAIDCGMVVVLYNNTCLAVVSTTSLLVASSIEYIKDPNEGSFDIALKNVSKNKSAEALLLKNLNKFNESCKKGEMERTCEELLKKNYAVKQEMALQEAEQCLLENPLVAGVAAIGGVPATIVAVSSLLVVISLIVPFLRELTVIFLNAKQSISDYLAIESDVLRMNAENVQYNMAKSDEAKTKIRNKQLKIADRLKKMSDALMVKMTKAAKIAEKEVANDKDEKVKINDVVDELPDSVASLF